MKHKLFSIAVLCTFLLVVIAQYHVFLIVPNERTMGPVQRIFYFHVGSAFACYVATAVMLIGGLGYLATRKRVFDAMQEAAGEVGLLFCSIVLITGMIWAASAWNIPFSFREPRLVSTLVLWLVFAAFVLLRTFGSRQDRAAHCAVLAILGAATVPIVVFSVKFLSGVGQLHPVVVEHGGLREFSYRTTFWLSNIAMVSVAGIFIYIRQQLSLREDS